MTNENVDELFDVYAADMPGPVDVFRGEVVRWRARWQLVAVDIPTTLISTLDHNLDAYPCIRHLLRILLTIPATSATCERSFSSLKRIKTYLRSTMSADRLSSLALLHVHRDMDVGVDVVLDTFAGAKNRKLDFM